MKKKIISLTVLLLTVITGAWADETPTLSTPLTIEVTSEDTRHIRVSGFKTGMQFSKNNGGKNTIGRDLCVEVTKGDKVQFYGKGTDITSYSGTTITGEAGLSCKVYGNIMSLVDENGFATATTLTATNAFRELFKGNIYLTDASHLLLPATTLTYGCYASMFYGCTALTTAPVLPATTLNVNQCYYEMFKGCSNLNSVTCLATSITAKECTDLWLDGVAGSGTFKTAYSNIWTPGGENSVPAGWTIIQLLNENTNNSDWISVANGDNLNVTLTRTLKAGGWNTFSVPFDVSNSVLTEKGMTVKKLSGASFNDGTKTLTLTFSDAESIVAGTPYLVQVENDVVNPTFSGVTISNSTTPTTFTGVIEFVPAINPTTLTKDDKRNLFVSGGNTLTWASSGSSMKGFRAYFHILNNDIANALAFTMDFNDATGIANCELPNVNSGQADAWYDLQGRRVQQPAKKGIYVVNGKKYVIK